MTKYYLRVEGVNLGNFVYDTQDLSTIRGSGLAILASVNSLKDKEFEINKKKLKLNKISTGASTGLFSFEAESDFDKANDLRVQIGEYLRNFSYEYQEKGRKVDIYPFRYATFVIDFSKAEVNFLIDREKVIAKNRWQQMQSPRFAIPKYANSNITEFKRVSCEVDSARRAEIKTKFKSGDKEISKSIYHRRRYGFDKKQSFIEQEIHEHFDVAKITNNFAWDFDDITFGKNDIHNRDKDKGNLHHKMAVIYLDGNDFGKKQMDLSIEKLKAFDSMKETYQRKFLAKLMEKIVDPNEGWQFSGENEKGELETHYQLEILLWGGDEICLVVPAWKGWETVELFYKETEELFFPDKASADKVRLTHSVGMVFCHHNAPIRRIKHLASKLADLAKEKSRIQNHFAYEILESFDHISKDLDEHRKSRCPQIEPININSTILDGNKMKEISNRLREVKTFFPKRKLTEIVINLLTEVESDLEKSERKTVIDKQIKSVEDSIGTENKEKLSGFVAQFGNNKCVALINALELWDYIEESN